MTESLPTPSVSNVVVQPSAGTLAQGVEDQGDKTERDIRQQIQEINGLVAQLRDLLISIGQSGDSPQLRKNIRKVRRGCIEACKTTSQQILPNVRKTTEIGIPVDSPNLTHLYYIMKLLLRELWKSEHLICTLPMDMSQYYETQTGPSNIGNVISQILLRKEITPDFFREEICSIKKDSEVIRNLIDELQEFMPQSDRDIGEEALLIYLRDGYIVTYGGFYCMLWHRSLVLLQHTTAPLKASTATMKRTMPENYSALQNAGKSARSNGRRVHRLNLFSWSSKSFTLNRDN